MYHISEIRKQNAQKAAETRALNEATWSPSRQGRAVTLRYGVRTYEIEDREGVARFLELVKDKNPVQTKNIVERIFQARSASLDRFALV